MPINWNLAGYVNPDIKITPNEVPLEAMVNVGDKLQKDYDMSYENYTKTQEALRQMENSAHDVDRETARNIFSRYEPELKKIAESGRYHDMKWQTQKLATQAANDYMSINERKRQILAQEEAIGKDPRYAFSKDQRVKAFRKTVPQLEYDAEKGVIKNLAINPYSAAADVNLAELSAKAASMMKPKDFGFNEGKLVFFDAEGKETSNPMESVRTVHRVEGRKDQVLSPEQIRSAVGKYLNADASVNAMLERDYNEVLELTGDPKKDAIIKQKYKESLINPALDAAGALFKIDNSFRNSDETEGQGMAYASLASGGPDSEGGNAELTSLNIDGKNAEGQELSTVFRNAAKGDITAKILTLSTLKTIEDKLKKEGKPDQAAYVKGQAVNMETVLDFVKKYPQFKNYLTNVNYLDPSGFTTFSEAVRVSGIPAEDKRKIAGVRSLHFGKGSIGNTLDTGLEDLFENSKSESFRNIPMQTPDLANDKVRNKFESLTSNLTIDDFEIDPEQWKDDSKNIKVVSRSTEPAGDGVGHLYRLQDSKGNSFFAEAKKQSGRSLDQQWAKYISNVDMNNYKDVTAPDRPTRFMDILKNAGIKYYETSADENNKKPKFAIDPEEKVIPMDGKFRVIDVDGKIHFYNSIFELINAKEIKYN